MKYFSHIFTLNILELDLYFNSASNLKWSHMWNKYWPFQTFYWLVQQQKHWRDDILITFPHKYSHTNTFFGILWLYFFISLNLILVAIRIYSVGFFTGHTRYLPYFAHSYLGWDTEKSINVKKVSFWVPMPKDTPSWHYR